MESGRRKAEQKRCRFCFFLLMTFVSVAWLVLPPDDICKLLHDLLFPLDDICERFMAFFFLRKIFVSIFVTYFFLVRYLWVLRYMLLPPGEICERCLACFYLLMLFVSVAWLTFSSGWAPWVRWGWWAAWWGGGRVVGVWYLSPASGPARLSPLWTVKNRVKEHPFLAHKK